MPRSDPEHRGLFPGCGAALFKLRTSAAHAGFEPEAALLPDPADPWLAAEVRLARPVRAKRDESDEGAESDDAADAAVLYPAIRRRHTSRLPFTDEEIPESLLDGLSGCAVREGARLVFPDPWHVRSVLDLVHDAEGHEAAEPVMRHETARWTRTDAAEEVERAEGIPAYAFGPRQWGVTSPLRDFAGRRPVPGRACAVFEKAPCLGLLGTADDTRTDWLRAGQAMERGLSRRPWTGWSPRSPHRRWSGPSCAGRCGIRSPRWAMCIWCCALDTGHRARRPRAAR